MRGSARGGAGWVGLGVLIRTFVSFVVLLVMGVYPEASSSSGVGGGLGREAQKMSPKELHDYLAGGWNRFVV